MTEWGDRIRDYSARQRDELWVTGEFSQRHRQGNRGKVMPLVRGATDE